MIVVFCLVLVTKKQNMKLQLNNSTTQLKHNNTIASFEHGNI